MTVPRQLRSASQDQPSPDPLPLPSRLDQAIRDEMGTMLDRNHDRANEFVYRCASEARAKQNRAILARQGLRQLCDVLVEGLPFVVIAASKRSMCEVTQLAFRLDRKEDSRSCVAAASAPLPTQCSWSGGNWHDQLLLSLLRDEWQDGQGGGRRP
jgi:hypothetical protein